MEIVARKKINIIKKGKKIMKIFKLKKFIMFYERLTKHMLKSLSKKANYVIKIDKKHRLKSIVSN